VSDYRVCVVSGFAPGNSSDARLHANAYVYTFGGKVVKNCHLVRPRGAVAGSAEREQRLRAEVRAQADAWVKAHS
jgi:hypothetical protein